MTNDILLQLTNLLKTKKFKIPSSDPIFQDITHDFIVVHIECENEECKTKEEKSFCETFEYCTAGLLRNVGKYRKIFKEVDSFTPKNINYLSLFVFNFKFKEKFKGSEYNFLLFNCKTFAKSFYSKLVQNEKASNELFNQLAGTAMIPIK